MTAPRKPAATARSASAPLAKTASAARPAKARATLRTEPPPAAPVLKVPKPSKTDKPARTGKEIKTDKVEKARKPKLVRDSFTIPKTEYQVLESLKDRSARLARPAKKSELLRAGIKALAGMSDANFLEALQAVPAIKTGRPRSGAEGAKAD